MFRTILKVLLVLVLLIFLGVAGVYLYLKFSPKKSITISGNNPIAKTIIQNTIPDLKSCNTNPQCNWYSENQGKPPDSEEPDRIINYCANATIKKQCPNCQIISKENQAEEIRNSALCQCIDKKCTPKEVSFSSNP